MKQLSVHKELLEDNLHELERNNNLLAVYLRGLQESPDIIKAESSRLNYVADNEGIIFISGWNNPLPTHLSNDIIKLSFNTPVRNQKNISRAFSIVAGLIIYVLFLLKKRVRNIQEKKDLNHIL